MKLKVTYEAGVPIRIERPPTLTEGFVAFGMHGSTAVWRGQDVDDLRDVMDAVEELGFVQAVTTEVQV